VQRGELLLGVGQRAGQGGRGVALQLARLGEVALLVAVPGLVVELTPLPAQARQLGGVGEAAAALPFLARTPGQIVGRVCPAASARSGRPRADDARSWRR
jgi:hypothetical protein